MPDDDTPPNAPLPLVVALEGGLTGVNTLHEAVAARLSAAPAEAPRLLGLARSGRLRAAMAEDAPLDPAALPLHEEVLERLRAARAEGRATALLAADARLGEAVAGALGLFDEVLAPETPDPAAAAALPGARFGAGGYVFIGPAADRAAFAGAAEASTVRAAPAARKAAEALAPGAGHIAPRPGGAAALKPWIKALRPRQWAKNALIFAPLLAAHQAAGFGAALAAFVAFSLLASSVYLVNDMLDLKADRAHPRKRARPFAAGDVPIGPGAGVAAGLVAVSILVALLFTPLAFLGVLAAYYVLTWAYSLTLKRKLILDIWTLSALYTIRIVAGAAATALPLSPWMLGFSIFLFLSLAAVKRMAELEDQIKRGVEQTAGRAYRTDDLPVVRGLAMSTGTASVLALALYISSPEAQALYSSPTLLWFVCVLMLYWVSRMVMVTHRGDMDDDPVVFAMKDRVSLSVLVLCALSFVAAGAL
ncbi:UbiA family prenyltransferase [Rhodovulum sp. DZ06]|uniref:UbiA family prenyltransferase n=1 Tax=Rhodovulum sp. DZ06 TaxID=3425126 RepID=UPI003D34982A